MNLTAIRMKANARLDGMKTGAYSVSETIGYLEGQVSVLLESGEYGATGLAHSLNQLMWNLKEMEAA